MYYNQMLSDISIQLDGDRLARLYLSPQMNRKGYTSMSRFRDTFDATRGDNEADRKHFDEVVKPRANAKVDRSFKETYKRPKPESEPE